MTTKEMSSQFDVLYNNITSNQAPSLNEYEKSVFLTKAQDEIIKNYFNARSRGNTLQTGFDDSPKRQHDFSILIKTEILTEDTESSKLDLRGRNYQFPKDFFISLNEELVESPKKYEETTEENVARIFTVVPLTFEEYSRLMKKPYKYPTKFQAWRLITGYKESQGQNIPIVQIIAQFVNTTDNVYYIIRYVRKPNPIILVNLMPEHTKLTIGGKGDETPCELPEELQKEILQRAVELAKLTWSGDQNNINNVLQTGQRSE